MKKFSSQSGASFAFLVFLYSVFGFGVSHDSLKISHSIERYVSLGDTLEGILEMPETQGKKSLVIFVHGSGRVDRSDYYNYVEKFWKKGYATFRYDKRGVGKSGGEFLRVNQASSVISLPKLADDVNATVVHLSKNKKIDPRNIILMGNSQAGWIIPMAANLGGVSKIVIVSGPAVTVGEQMYYSKKIELDNDIYSDTEIENMLSKYDGEQGFDPLPHLQNLKIPALWFIGRKDRSIPAVKTINAIREIGRKYNKDFVVEEFSEADHSLKNIRTGQSEDPFPYLFKWLKSN